MNFHPFTPALLRLPRIVSSVMLWLPYGFPFGVRQGMMDCDFIAYQDEIGVQKSQPEDTAAYYEALRKAHDKAGRAALWADMEVFEFEGQVYRSALLPAEFSRIERQMTSISPYVDEILIYQYEGMFNKPGTKAYCGHPDSIKLYNDYAEFLKRNK